MKNDSIKKQIDCIRDIKSHLWTGLVVSIGGTIGLSFNIDSLYKIILVIIGIVLIIVFFLAYFQKDILIESLLNKLEKE